MKKKINETDVLLDSILAEVKTQDDMEALLKDLTKRVIERSMKGELSSHLGYEKNSNQPKTTPNRRNGSYSKRVTTPEFELEIDVPRDRDGSYQPQIIKKNESRFTGFDKKIISLYSRGMSVRDIQDELQETYDIDVSPDLISSVTNEIMDDVIEWRNRPLDEVYPIIFLDCIVVKCRQDKHIINKSVFLALAVNMEGKKELLGMYIAENEGSKFWLSVINELKSRGVKDIFIACVDGLKGFPEAINSVFPNTQIQLCIVHQIRSSLKYVPHKDRKEVAADLKAIYGASTLENAELSLELFAEKWDNKYGVISRQWRSNWLNLTSFFDYPDDIRKAIYTTNAIESLNHSLRKTLKTKGVFPNDDSIFKIMYLSINRISKKWTMPIRNWSLALNQFAIRFEGRLPF